MILKGKLSLTQPVYYCILSGPNLDVCYVLSCFVCPVIVFCSLVLGLLYCCTALRGVFVM